MLTHWCAKKSAPGDARGSGLTLLLKPLGGVQKVPVWDRVEMPRQLPDVVTDQWLRTLTDEEFAEVLRSNLLPRSDAPAARRSWDACWRILTDWPDLQERAQETLNGFLNAVEEQLLAIPEDKRAKRFQELVDARRRQLDPAKVHRGGANATKGEQMLAAINTHRRVILASGEPPRPADIALWSHLGTKRSRR